MTTPGPHVQSTRAIVLAVRALNSALSQARAAGVQMVATRHPFPGIGCAAQLRIAMRYESPTVVDVGHADIDLEPPR